MTTSDKITHAMDVVFLIGILVLVYFFMRTDREHEREISALEGKVSHLEGKVISLESKLGTAPSTQPGQ